MKQVKELSTIQSLPANSTSEDKLTLGNYAVGFMSADFIIWNLTNESKVLICFNSTFWYALIQHFNIPHCSSFLCNWIILYIHWQVVQVPCGGWRRPHSYYLGDVPECQNSFAYLKVFNSFSTSHVFKQISPKIRSVECFPLRKLLPCIKCFKVCEVDGLAFSAWRFKSSFVQSAFLPFC